MALFGSNKPVLEIKGAVIGEFDPAVEGFYKNVVPFRFEVKKNRVLHTSVRSDGLVDVALIDEKGSPVTHVDRQTSLEIDAHTGSSREMSIILGVYPGDKVVVDAEIWMCKK
ncbi:MAG: hypothetical protein LBS92_08085 [Candidatus Methanoplasma sp.]|nr:hypothetical protein [Candidatus Methanoplasma sp.]